ncbi:MAG: mechanosensitive ion channel [Acidobacteriota bacterium]|jgi:hypothetical protein
MKIIFDLFAGLLLWAILSAIRKGVAATAHRAAALQRIQSFLPTIAAILWFFYGLWLIHGWFANQAIFPILLFFYIAIPALLIYWFVLRDVIAGLVFSSRMQFQPGRRIQHGDMSGRIIRKGAAHLLLRTDSGDTVRIPYSSLSGKIVTEKSEETESDYFRIHLSLRKQDRPDLLQARLAHDIIANPWASASTPPIVRLQKQTDSSCEFEILFRSLNSRHAARVENAIRNMYERSI